MFDPSRVFENLGPMEQDLVEAEANALRISVEEMVVALVREGLAVVMTDGMEKILLVDLPVTLPVIH